MKFFTALLAIFLSFPVMAAEKRKTDPGANIVGLLGHRLSYAKKYSDLPTIFNLRKEDQALFIQDLIRQKRYQSEFRFSTKGAVLTFLNKPAVAFDFSKVAEKKLLVNGTPLQLGGGRNEYRNNLIKLNKIINAKISTPKEWWRRIADLPRAHALNADLPPAEYPELDPAVAAFVEEAEFAVEHLEDIYMGGDPSEIIIANYKYDEAIMVRTTARANRPPGSDPIYMMAVDCQLPGSRKWVDREYRSNGSEVAATRDTRDENDKLYFDQLAALCCENAGCEEKTRSARLGIAVEFKVRSDDGMLIRAVGQ